MGAHWLVPYVVYDHLLCTLDTYILQSTFYLWHNSSVYFGVRDEQLSTDTDMT